MFTKSLFSSFMFSWFTYSWLFQLSCSCQCLKPQFALSAHDPCRNTTFLLWSLNFCCLKATVGALKKPWRSEKDNDSAAKKKTSPLVKCLEHSVMSSWCRNALPQLPFLLLLFACPIGKLQQRESFTWCVKIQKLIMVAAPQGSAGNQTVKLQFLKGNIQSYMFL